MTREIERKYIVINDSWKRLAQAEATEDITQGYLKSPASALTLCIENNALTNEQHAILSFQKEERASSGKLTYCKKWLYPIPAEDARQMLETPYASVRVRISTNSATGAKESFLTLKSKRKIANDTAIDRREWEYPLAVEQAQDMLDHLCDMKISKRRYHLHHDGKDWSIDEFKAPKYRGLKLAEIELEHAKERFSLPPFVTAKSEVTKDERFASGHLADPKKDMGFLKKTISKAQESARSK